MDNSSCSKSKNSACKISSFSRHSNKYLDKPLDDFLLEPGLPEVDRKALRSLREVPEFKEVVALLRRRLKRAHERVIMGDVSQIPLVRELIQVCNYLEGKTWIQGQEVPEGDK